MGIINFFKKRAFNKILAVDDTEKQLNEYMKASMKENQDALRFAKKMTKAKFLKLQTNDLLTEMREPEEEYEEEQSDSLEDKIGAALINKFMGNLGGANPINPLPTEANPIQSGAKEELQTTLSGMTEEQAIILKKQLMGS